MALRILYALLFDHILIETCSFQFMFVTSLGIANVPYLKESHFFCLMNTFICSVCALRIRNFWYVYATPKLSVAMPLFHNSLVFRILTVDLLCTLDAYRC